MSTERDLDSLITFTSSRRCFQSATLASAIATDTSYDFLTFLGVAQSLNLEFLPISWDAGEASIGQGGTAEISQPSISLETAFAFKRLVFEKTKFGDLGKFMRHGAGRQLNIMDRLKLCVEIADGVSDLHLNGE